MSEEPANNQTAETPEDRQQGIPEPLPVNQTGISFNKKIPVITELLDFLRGTLKDLGFDPDLAAPILITVAVLIIGTILLVLIPLEQRLLGLIVLVVLITIVATFTYSITKGRRNG